MNDMKLSGETFKQLYLALIDAFPTTASLERMLTFGFDDKNLRAIAGEGILQDIVFKLIQAAKSEGWVEDLVRAAQKTNPGNQKLFVFHNEIEVANSPITKYFDNELVPILTNIDFDICEEIATKILHGLDQSLDRFRIKNINNIRNFFLKEFSTKLTDGSLPIVNFADSLANDNRLEKLDREDLKAWADKVSQYLDKVMQPLNLCLFRPYNYKIESHNYKIELNKNSNSYLLIFLNHKNNQFSINAFLIPNDEDKEGIEPLDLDEEQKGIFCSENEIKIKIDLLIKKAEKILRLLTIKKSEPIIEFFLTIDYIHRQVEHWKLGEDDFLDNYFIGQDYKVVVRSYDRVKYDKFLRELDKGRSRLEKFRAELNEPLIHNRIEYLKELDNSDWEGLRYRLEKNIGLLCSLPLTDEECKKLFSAIIQSGIPIAMWTRTNNITNICVEDEIKKKYSVSSLKDFRILFELLRDERKKAYAKNNECKNYLGYHLGVLCEDPKLEDFPNFIDAIRAIL
ncbi:hypothetical protein HW132_22570 [Brasilonema sp. CT11]|nr:hypothetical protein [Brasilonema sp. CT11]